MDTKSGFAGNASSSRMKERNTVVALVQDQRDKPIIIQFKKGPNSLKFFDDIKAQ